MAKIHLLVPCTHCQGQAYLPAGQGINCQGEAYTRYQPCPVCQGSGEMPFWADLRTLLQLLRQEACPHERTSLYGTYHFSGGELWDDLTEICDDCGQNLSQRARSEPGEDLE